MLSHVQQGVLEPQIILEPQIKRKNLHYMCPIRKSSRTSLKRRLRWDEEKPNLSAYDQPLAIAGPPHVSDEVPSQGPSKKPEKVSPASTSKGRGVHVPNTKTCLTNNNRSFNTAGSCFICPSDDHDDDGETTECDDDNITHEDLAHGKKEENLKKTRKLAGIPELELDALPSALANKMSYLFIISAIFLWHPTFQCLHFFCRSLIWWHGAHLSKPRVCLAKRQSKLQDLLDKFDGAQTLSDLQKRNPSWGMHAKVYSPIYIACFRTLSYERFWNVLQESW